MEEALRTIDRLIEGFFASLPKLALALIIIVLFILIASAVRGAISRAVANRRRRNLGRALGRLASLSIIFAGLLVGVSVVSPTIGAAELLQLLGVGSVAIGFAFRDILQNFLAGILLLLREPFRQGDRVIFQDYEGVVEEITTRSTLIKTYDGNRIIVPNGEVYTHPLTVLTAFPYIRTCYEFGVGYENDLSEALAVIADAVSGTPGVLETPEPVVEVGELAPSTVDIRALWWTENADALTVRGEVLKGVKLAADSAGITMPYPTSVVIRKSPTESDARNPTS